jgi:hypothetical protein
VSALFLLDLAGDCSKKAVLPGRKRALHKASLLAKHLGEPIDAWHCDEHHGWHLGHPRGWRAANGRQVRRRRP